MCSFAVNTSCSSTTTQNPSRPGHSDLRARGNQGSHLFSHITCSVTAASRVSKMPCSEVTEAVSPHKRSKSDAANGYEEQMVLKFAKLTENATTPSRGSNRAAGFDLYRWESTLRIQSPLCSAHVYSCIFLICMVFSPDSVFIFVCFKFKRFFHVYSAFCPFWPAENTLNASVYCCISAFDD